MPTFAHFMIPAENPGRVKKFYEELFGWNISKADNESGYYHVETHDMEGCLALRGGMMESREASSCITNFIGVDSIDKWLPWVEKLGGKIIRKKTPVPGCGFMALCRDTENNVFGLWEDEK